MKTNNKIIGRLAVGVALVFGQISNTYAALTDAQRAQIEQTIQKLEAATSNMMAQVAAAQASLPATTAAQLATQQVSAAQATLDLFESNRLAVFPFLHSTVKMPDGTPASSVQDALDAQTMATSSNADGILSQQQAELDDALAFGATNGWPAEIVLPSGSRARLVSREGGVPNYLTPLDLQGAVTLSTTNVWPGGSTGFNLTGTNTTISIWDEASPRLTHVEFTNNRVTELDGNTNLSDHSTAVAGVLAAGGNIALFSNGVPIGFAAKGMAFAGQVQARDNNFDLGEMTGAVGTNHMRLSNQSYGSVQGWFVNPSGQWFWLGNPEISGNEDPKFGNYTTNATRYDALIQGAPTYLSVWAAGNSLSNGPPVQPTNHVEFDLQGNGYFTNAVRPLDGDAGGFDTLTQQATAKNTLAVGAVFPLSNGYSGPTSVFLAPFSSCGPTDDGRIKPDVVADGINNVLPIADSSDMGYAFGSGTSFAAPGVTGSAGLLAQLYKQLHPNSGEPLASTLRGLVIHAADSCTTNGGPSYRFGWGVMNTRTAATLINADATNGLKNQIKEVLLNDGLTIRFPVVSADGTNNPLKLTICWTDPAGAPNSVTNLDNPAPKLVNDLDLRVIAPNGTTNFPWVLNPDLTNQTPAARSAVATTGDDSRNNVEQVYIPKPTNGTYTVTVTHKGSLINDQWVSILISGNVPQATPTLVINQFLQTSTNTFAIGWPAVVGAQYQLQSSTNLPDGWSNVDGIISARLTNVVTQVSFSQANAKQLFRVVQLP